MKMNADNCVSRIYGRYGDETQASDAAAKPVQLDTLLVGGRAD